MRESAGRGGTGLATCALRELGAECRGTFGPFFCPPISNRHVPNRGVQRRHVQRRHAQSRHASNQHDSCRPRTRSIRSGTACGVGEGSGHSRMARTHRAEERCRRPTGSGTGGIRISPPGVGDSYRDTSDSDATGQTGLACDQFGRLARAFRALDRDGILVPTVRFDVPAAKAVATPCADAAAAPTRDAPAASHRAPHRHRQPLIPVAAP